MADEAKRADGVVAVIATADRPLSLAECLRGLAGGSRVVERVIVVDASSNREASRLATRPEAGTWPFEIEFIESERRGAAAQRQRALDRVDGVFVLFLDDDAVVEPDCVAEMMEGFSADGDRVAGVAANLVNQPVPRPGLATRVMYFLMGGGCGSSYSGRLLGPAVGVRPEEPAAERFTAIEWAATTCVMYRREAVAGGFRSFFTGYSLGEDVALSVDARRFGEIRYARDARVIHTPRQSLHPAPREYGRMEVLNRWFLTQRVLARDGFSGRLRFGLWLAWEWVASLPWAWRDPGVWRQSQAGRWEAMGALWRGDWDE